MSHWPRTNWIQKKLADMLTEIHIGPSSLPAARPLEGSRQVGFCVCEGAGSCDRTQCLFQAWWWLGLEREDLPAWWPLGTPPTYLSLFKAMSTAVM